MADPESKPKVVPPLLAALLSALISWPAFAILVIALFWTPLRQTGALLPRLLENSETITLGTLTLQIKQNLKVLAAQAGPEVRSALSGMDADDALVVLNNNLQASVLYSGVPPDEAARWQKLSRLGLVKVLTDKELRNLERLHKYKSGHYTFGIDPTEKYFKTYKFLARAVFEIANASTSGESPTSAERK